MEAAAARGMRRRIWAGVAAYAAIMLAVALSLSHLYRESRDSLDEALGERLAGVAVTASYLVDGDSLAVWSYDPQESLEFLWLRSRLEQVRRENDLSELVLCDADGFVLVSAVRRLGKGDVNVYWDLDPGAVASAREGFSMPSRLYRAGDVMQKSAHAPIWNSSGQVAGVITVEAEAEFLEALAALRRAAWATAVLVLVFLGAMALLLSRQQRSLVRARSEIMRQENLAMMGRMTAGIAHEIRNPLGIIRGAGEIQAQRLRTAGIDLPTLDFIPDEVDRLDRILTRYLTFGKGGNGFDLEPLDLGKLVRRSVHMADQELAAAGVELAVETPDEPLLVSGDNPSLQQVMLNLLLNARDAMPAGGRIVVRLEQDGGAAVLSILDEGTGLGDLSEREIFEPFLTTKEKGSGLGLAVVRQVVEDHHGAISLRGRDDGPGTVAEVRLPLHDRDDGR
ncbi:hypothetical protein KJ554_14480 [bacterium]|nr:hypothetical protein [bacterium]